MRTEVLEFEGAMYTCRVVESVDGEDLLIGSTELLDALQPGSFEDANEGFTNKEAEDLYDEVFYFTEPQNLLLPDNIGHRLHTSVGGVVLCGCTGCVWQMFLSHRYLIECREVGRIVSQGCFVHTSEKYFLF